MSPENTDTKRISDLEKDHSGMKTDIRGIYAGLEEIREAVIRLAENAKPNLTGLFLVLLATCTFLITVGGLTMAPAFRELGRHSEEISEVRAGYMEQMELIGRLNERTMVLYERSREQQDEMHKTQERVQSNAERIAYMEGQLKE